MLHLKKWVRNQENVQDIIELFSAQNNFSLSRAENELQISKTSIWRVLDGLKYHPYKLQVVQELLPPDFQLRVSHAENQLALNFAEPHYFSSILFSDEAHFHLHGGVNNRNFRFWHDSNPGWNASKPLHSPRVTVWAGLSVELGLIGPFFFEQNVNADNYLQMLQQNLLPAIEHHQNFQRVVFQQDGAPPHYAIIVRNFLNETFPSRWIGRGSELPWPARSPDLTPMDYFLWGYIKFLVYREPIPNVQVLRQRIVEAFAEVPHQMIVNAINGYERRLRRCIELNGRSVEVYGEQ